MTDALTMISAPGYAFTRSWFKKNSGAWSNVFTNHRPARMLEIGSFEGFSACWSIAQAQVIGLDAFEIHCIDTWEGGIEHQEGSKEAVEMATVERRFATNIAKAKRDSGLPSLDVHVHKALSHLALGDLIAQRRLGYFDLIYIDGSHQAPDVLTDAVMSFPLLRDGGIMVFDDYLWTVDEKGSEDPLAMPKPAVDAFANLFLRKISVIKGGTGEQLFMRKRSD
jgi:predicted O-methyltransferase YrrM